METGEEKLQKHHIVVAFCAVFAMISIGTFSYQILEGWSIITSLYFSVATLTTVGYGDIHPTTDASRIFTVFYILIGVSIVLSSLTIIVTDRINNTASRVKKFSSLIKSKN